MKSNHDLCAIIIITMIMAINSKDIETLWGRYQSEGVSKGVSVSQYFEANGIPYHVLEKWYKKRFRSLRLSSVSLTGCLMKRLNPVHLLLPPTSFHSKTRTVMFSLTGATRYKYIPNCCERAVRPFTNLRKNFGGFSSEAGAAVAATYLTFVETCKLMKKTALDFFKGFIGMTSSGRTDYELITQELLC